MRHKSAEENILGKRCRNHPFFRVEIHKENKHSYNVRDDYLSNSSEIELA